MSLNDIPSVNCYRDALDLLKGRTTKKLANNTYAIRGPNGSVTIRLHQTDIVVWHEDDTVVLNDGGWKTSTTKNRMNRFLPPHLNIFQEKNQWYFRDHSTPYTTGMRISLRKDHILVDHKEGKLEQAKKEQSLAKKIKKFVKGYIDALDRGEVPKPREGDCWFCCFHVVEGPDKGKSLGDATGDTEHLLSHFEKKYYVPSLLNNAVKEVGGIAPVAHWYLQAKWSGGKDSFAPDVARAQLRRCLERYLRRRFGLVDSVRTVY